MFNKENIMRIDFTERIAGIEINYIALYNQTKITDEEVRRAIDLRNMGQNKNVIIISKEQFINVFND